MNIIAAIIENILKTTENCNETSEKEKKRLMVDQAVLILRAFVILDDCLV